MEADFAGKYPILFVDGAGLFQEVTNRFTLLLSQQDGLLGAQVRPGIGIGKDDHLRAVMFREIGQLRHEFSESIASSVGELSLPRRE